MRRTAERPFRRRFLLRLRPSELDHPCGVPLIEEDILRKLFSTQRSHLTVVRLVLGIVFFAHGAQKMLGWFGGYGFHGTMGFFTSRWESGALAFLAICAEFFGAWD